MSSSAVRKASDELGSSCQPTADSLLGYMAGSDSEDEEVSAESSGTEATDEDDVTEKTQGVVGELDQDLNSNDDEFASADEGSPSDLFSFDGIRKKFVTEAEEFAHMVKKETEEFAHKISEEAGEIAHKIYEAGWRVVHHAHLPEWMRDNEFLHAGHRPELGSFWECFKSIFKIHTETGNIWTHLVGMVAFVIITVYYLTRPSIEINWREKAVLSAFFLGAVACLGFSTLFHTVFCHSQRVGKFFNKLDYCGITFLTVGSFVPWLYYSFYCRSGAKIGYLVLISVLGSACLVVSLWEKFSEPQYRALRAGMFVALGLSGVIPAVHFVITDGLWNAINNASLGYLGVMALLYILGAVIYAVRIPERLFPGKFDIWFQSHQIFHVLVVAAAVVHYYGIMSIASFRLSTGECISVPTLIES